MAQPTYMISDVWAAGDLDALLDHRHRNETAVDPGTTWAASLPVPVLVNPDTLTS